MFFQIESVNSDGTNRRTIISDPSRIHKPVALAVMDRRLYYLDTSFEQIVRVDLPNGDNQKVLMENEPELKTLNLYRYRLLLFLLLCKGMRYS